MSVACKVCHSWSLPATPLEALNPVSWWKLDEPTVAIHVSDASSALPGVTLKRNTAQQQVPGTGRSGSALHFLNGYSYLSNVDTNTTAQVRALNFTSTMSIEVWVQFDQLPSDYATTAGNVKLVYRVNSLFKSGYEMFVSATDNKPHLKVWNSTTRAEVVADEALTTDQWYHLVGTYDGTHLRLYVNGALEGITLWASGR